MPEGGGEGVWQKMIDDDDEAGDRRENTLTALQDTLCQISIESQTIYLRDIKKGSKIENSHW